MSRIGKIYQGVSALVKKTARFAVQLTKGMVMTCVSTRSRTKKWRRSMCFERWWCSGLYARSIADLLSIESAVGSVAARPRSAKSERK
eukprot:5365235-Pleurochrysis_carterae.AAC.1